MKNKYLEINEDTIKDAIIVVSGKKMMLGDIFDIDVRTTVFGGTRITLTEGI